MKRSVNDALKVLRKSPSELVNLTFDSEALPRANGSVQNDIALIQIDRLELIKFLDLSQRLDEVKKQNKPTKGKEVSDGNKSND